jgi:hypothetical protein
MIQNTTGNRVLLIMNQKSLQAVISLMALMACVLGYTAASAEEFTESISGHKGIQPYTDPGV